MASILRQTGPFAQRNPRLFVWFTTLYNARSYYPVLAIFFTDLGLSLDQYVLLNAVWAASIFLLEVPSGALADTLGRKRLLVFSAAVMVLEMGVLLVAPKDGGWLLFALCLFNRFLSGASEAAASGADEAIAYDALPETNRAALWDEVLAAAMRWRSAGFLVAMTLGGFLYDPSWLEKLGMGIPLDVAHRLPVALVFVQALACLFIALRFEETRHDPHPDGHVCAGAWKLTLATARRALTTRSIAIVLLGAVLIDAVARNFATLNSAYYRLIHLPEWSFGLIGSLIAVGNWFLPTIAKRVNQSLSTTASLLAGGVVTALLLAMVAPAWPWAGVLPAMLLMMMLGFVSFTVSRFLHSVATSAERATLLSVKGLIFNLGYGAYSLAFSGLLAAMRTTASDASAFPRALAWQAGGFVVALLVYALVARGPRPR